MNLAYTLAESLKCIRRRQLCNEPHNLRVFEPILPQSNRAQSQVHPTQNRRVGYDPEEYDPNPQ